MTAVTFIMQFTREFKLISMPVDRFAFWKSTEVIVFGEKSC